MAEQCMSLPRLAEHFGVARTVVFSAVKRQEIPAFQIGSLWRVRLSDIPTHVVARWSRPKLSPYASWPEGRLVYFLGIPGFVKIGWTADISRRALELQPGSPHQFELLAHVPGAEIADERRYHRRFHDHRAESEWFHLTPDILAEIDRLNALVTPLAGRLA